MFAIAQHITRYTLAGILFLLGLAIIFVALALKMLSLLVSLLSTALYATVDVIISLLEKVEG